MGAQDRKLRRIQYELYRSHWISLWKIQMADSTQKTRTESEAGICHRVIANHFGKAVVINTGCEFKEPGLNTSLATIYLLTLGNWLNFTKPPFFL